jgi:hypothetical protein
MSLAINILASGLICLRLFLAQGQTVGQEYTTRIRNLFWAYLKSGSIYPTVIILTLAFYLSGSPYGWFLNTISPQICGMMPTLMVIVILYEGQSLSNSGPVGTAFVTDSFSMRTGRLPQSYVDQFVATEILSHSELKHGLEVHVEREEHRSTKAISSHIRILSVHDQI